MYAGYICKYTEQIYVFLLLLYFEIYAMNFLLLIYKIFSVGKYGEIIRFVLPSVKYQQQYIRST